MSTRPILHIQEVEGPASEWELGIATEYVKENCRLENDQPIELERVLLGALFDTARKGKTAGVILPLYVARLVGATLRAKHRGELPKYEGYKRGVMKIFADRSARSPAAQAKKIASAAETRRTGKKKKRTHPEDVRPKHKRQLVLL